MKNKIIEEIMKKQKNVVKNMKKHKIKGVDLELYLNGVRNALEQALQKQRKEIFKELLHPKYKQLYNANTILLLLKLKEKK